MAERAQVRRRFVALAGVALLIPGLLFGGLGARMLWRQIRVNRLFQPVSATITGSTERNGEPWIVFRYAVGGREYQSNRRRIEDAEVKEKRSPEAVRDLLARYPVGLAVTAYYNPADPGTAVLERGCSATPFLVLFAGLLPGGGGLAFLLVPWLRRLRRREDARALREALRDPAARPAYLDGIRRADGAVPGRRLAWRLKPLGPRPGKVVPGLIFTAIGVPLLAGMAWLWHSMWAELNWIAVCTLSAFTALGLLLTLAVVWELVAWALRRWRFPPTRLEVSVYPLRLGDEFVFALEQPAGGGRVQLRLAELELVGEEGYQQTVRSGSRSFTQLHREDAVRQTGARAEAQVLREAAPLAVEGTFHIPPAAVPGLAIGSRRGRWFLRLRLEAAGCPDVERVFPLRVLPALRPVGEAAPGAPGTPALGGPFEPANEAAQRSGIAPTLVVETPRGGLAGGAVVRGRVQASLPAALATRRVTLTAEWTSDDEGDAEGDDAARVVLLEGPLPAGAQAWPFELELPVGPPSLRGGIIRLGWRWRLDFNVSLARDPAFTRPFTLAPPELPTE